MLMHLAAGSHRHQCRFPHFPCYASICVRVLVCPCVSFVCVSTFPGEEPPRQVVKLMPMLAVACSHKTPHSYLSVRGVAEKSREIYADAR